MWEFFAALAKTTADLVSSLWGKGNKSEPVADTVNASAARAGTAAGAAANAASHAAGKSKAK
jgi:hypothetical protein